MQLEVKTLLNQIQHFVGFVYSDIRLRSPRGKLCLEVTVESHEGRRGECSECRGSAPGYDHLPERWWLFVPVWGIVTWFRYAPRRGKCATHGGVVEHIPWSQGRGLGGGVEGGGGGAWVEGGERGGAGGGGVGVLWAWGPRAVFVGRDGAGI